MAFAQNAILQLIFLIKDALYFVETESSLLQKYAMMEIISKAMAALQHAI